MTYTGRRDSNTCSWPRCKRTDLCCAVPHPNDHTLTRGLCDRHFEVWHETQEPKARAALVLRIFGRKVRPVRP